MAYDLVIIWDNGEQSIYPYYTEDLARQNERNMRMVFGNQISYSYTRKAF